MPGPARSSASGPTPGSAQRRARSRADSIWPPLAVLDSRDYSTAVGGAGGDNRQRWKGDHDQLARATLCEEASLTTQCELAPKIHV
jgi:hypothetical protein